MPGNAADVVLAILAGAGVNSVYGVSGDAIFPLLDAISRQDAVRYYAVTHECNAAFMAAYEGRVTGRLAVCTATSSPGTANLINGLADAYFNRAPVLVITGQVDTVKMGTNAKQYFHQQDLIKTFASFSETVVNPQALAPVLLSAVQTAVDEKTVAHVAVPRDVFLQPVELQGLPPVAGRSYVMGGPLAEELETAVNILANSRRLLIMIGSGDPETARLAHDLGAKRDAGIGIAQQVKGVIADEAAGVIGGIGEGYVPALLDSADSILLIGSAPYEMSFLPRAVPMVQIGEEPGDINYDRVRCGMVGSLRLVLKLLLERVSLHREPPWHKEIEQERETRRQMIRDDAANNRNPIHPARLMAALNLVAAEDAVITHDIGSFVHWFERDFLARRQLILSSGRWRSMGVGLPAAIAAKIAATQRQVVALVGDGGFLMSMSELVTAVRYRLPVTVVVVNNHSYNLEKQKMALQGLNPFGYKLTVPDFVLYARACGAKGYKVDRAENLESVLTQALQCGEPALVDIQVADEPLPFLK